jgi:hypothetical protein
VAALGQLGAMGRRALMLLHVFVGGGEGLGRACILAEQTLHALRHALQQLGVDVIVAQPVGADFGNLVEQFARGVLVAHEEAGSAMAARASGTCRRPAGGRHRVGALLLLHLLHQQAQRSRLSRSWLPAGPARRARCAAGRPPRLQVGNAGGRAGLGLQAREHRIDGRAGHGSGVRRRGSGVAACCSRSCSALPVDVVTPSGAAPAYPRR